MEKDKTSRREGGSGQKVCSIDLQPFFNQATSSKCLVRKKIPPHIVFLKKMKIRGNTFDGF